MIFMVILFGTLAILLIYSYADPFDYLFTGAALIIVASALLTWVAAGFIYMLLGMLVQAVVVEVVGVRVWAQGVVHKAGDLIATLITRNSHLSSPVYKRFISRRKTRDLLLAVNLCDIQIHSMNSVAALSSFDPDALVNVRDFLMDEITRRGELDQLTVIE